MKRNIDKKAGLRLARETVREIGQAYLDRVVGGSVTTTTGGSISGAGGCAGGPGTSTHPTHCGLACAF